MKQKRHQILAPRRAPAGLLPLLALSGLVLTAKVKATEFLSALDAPQEWQAFPSPDLRYSAIRVLDTEILALSPELKQLRRVPFRIDEKDPHRLHFADMLDTKRVTFEVSHMRLHWVGLDVVDDLALLFEGAELHVPALSLKNYHLMNVQSMTWDRIRETGDSRGSSTTWENAQARKKLKNIMLERDHIASLVGLEPIPKQWGYGKDQKNSRRYLALSELPGFEWLSLSCQGDLRNQCSWEERCDAPSFGKKDSLMQRGNLKGLALIPTSERLALTYMIREHALLLIKFDSCLNIRPLKTIQLDDKVPSVGNLFVDEQQRLWLTTDRFDNYFNAALFYWPVDMYRRNSKK